MGYRVSRQEYIRLKHIEKQFGALAALETVRSGFVYGNIDTIVPTEDRTDFEIRQMHWEFIPNWVYSMDDLLLIRKGIDPKTGAKKAPIPWLNAKSENLLTNAAGKKSMWADAARKKRCLLTATHFFEWRHYKPEGAKKDINYPYYIDFYHEDEPFFIPGIYNNWTDKKTGENMDTVALVTTEANDLMQQIHNTKKRQPTILPEDLAWEWLMEDMTDERLLEVARYQLPSKYMTAYTIPKDFQICEDPLQFFQYEELPELV
jgi:putative SOS response-associated peptidase YedK